ncbi:CHAT domain-containing protein [Geodermatophilus sp. SYSU D00758]
MELGDALLLLSDTPAEDVARRLRRLAAGATVVIRREFEGQVFYYVFSAEAVSAAAARHPRSQLDAALGLHEWESVGSLGLAEAAEAELTRPAVLVEGDRLLGVLQPTAGDRSGGDGGTVGEGTSRGGPTLGGEVGRGSVAVGGGGPTPPPPDAKEPVRHVEGDRGRASPGGGLFRAFPHLSAPESVRSGMNFDLVVRLSATDASASTTPLLIPSPPETLRFVVQVAGFGFQFPSGIRAPLLVPQNDPDAEDAEVRFVVRADPVATDVTRVLEVSYEYEGNVCGRAWRQVLVGSVQPPRPVAPVQTGGTGIQPPPSSTAPHLGVDVINRQGGAELEWTFHSRYPDLTFPTGKVTTRLTEGSAEEFAVLLAAEVTGARRSPLLRSTLMGVGRAITAVLPVQFWKLLDEAWSKAAAAGEQPQLLLTTNEPYVPWELAWLDEDFVDASLLPQGMDGGWLGQFWSVGRWVAPTPTARGGDRPPQPPSTDIDVQRMVVAVGDYASDTRLRELPEATAEGNDLALTYDALRIVANEDSMDQLLSDRLTRGGEPFHPDVVHIAAHGQVSLNAQQYSGVVLSGSGKRMSPITVLGSKFDVTQPFVFLNACQVGTAGSILSTYGGMPGAFLGEGCRGYLAPLWDVDDDVARAFATEFYRETLRSQRPVADVLRELRSRFGTDWAPGSATPLAYVFYGHPALVLST